MKPRIPSMTASVGASVQYRWSSTSAGTGMSGVTGDTSYHGITSVRTDATTSSSAGGGSHIAAQPCPAAKARARRYRNRSSSASSSGTEAAGDGYSRM